MLFVAEFQQCVKIEKVAGNAMRKMVLRDFVLRDLTSTFHYQIPGHLERRKNNSKLCIHMMKQYKELLCNCRYCHVIIN